MSLYTNKVQFGYANIMFKPASRVTANVGYNLTSTTGFTPTLADPDDPHLSRLQLSQAYR